MVVSHFHFRIVKEFRFLQAAGCMCVSSHVNKKCDAGRCSCWEYKRASVTQKLACVSELLYRFLVARFRLSKVLPQVDVILQCLTSSNTD